MYLIMMVHWMCCRGFNDAVNGFADDGWSLLGNDGVEDVTIVINSSPSKLLGTNVNSSGMFSSFGGGILCAKASMLLQVQFSYFVWGLFGWKKLEQSPLVTNSLCLAPQLLQCIIC